MILPLGDQPNPKGVPYVTYAILAVNVAVYILVSLPLGGVAADPQDPMLLEYLETIGRSLPQGVSISEVARQVSAYDLVVFSYGYRPVAPSVIALFTAMFLHGGFMHLFGNMLFLWIYGDNVEHRLGSIAFAFWYLGTGMAATLTHALFDSHSAIPMVGASGAISGVLGFYFVWFPHNKVRLWIFIFPIYMNVILAPARWVLGFYILIDNIVPFLATRGLQGAGVAYGAHIGGFLAGLAVAAVMNRRQVTSRPAEYRAAPAPKAATRAATRSSGERIASAIRAGDLKEAVEIYFAVPPERSRRLLEPDDAFALGEWLAQNRHSQAALVVFQRHLRDYPTGPGAAEAHAAAGLLQLYSLKEPTAAFQHLVDALDLGPSPATEKQVRKALDEIAARQKFQVKDRRR